MKKTFKKEINIAVYGERWADTTNEIWIGDSGEALVKYVNKRKLIVLNDFMANDEVANQFWYRKKKVG